MTRGLVVLAAVVLGLALGSAPVAAVAPLPGTDYLWVQPGTALVNNPHAQPSAWVQIGPAPAFHPVSAYDWAQPGTAPVVTAHAQPPASVPIA
jgi:hypothetical protein